MRTTFQGTGSGVCSRSWVRVWVLVWGAAVATDDDTPGLAGVRGAGAPNKKRRSFAASGAGRPIYVPDKLAAGWGPDRTGPSSAARRPGMNKGELIDQVAVELKASKADAGRAVE